MLQSEIVTSLMEAKLLKNWTWTIFSAFWCNMSDMILVLKIMMIMIIEYFQFGPRLGAWGLGLISCSIVKGAIARKLGLARAFRQTLSL